MRLVAAFSMMIAVLTVSACSVPEAAPEEQPIPVRTFVVQDGAVPNIIEVPGRVEAVRRAEVRARVTGIVLERLYEEGTDVARNQPLFRIDPREIEASVNQQSASLQRAQATSANARAVVERYRRLINEQAISQQEFDAAMAAEREAAASVAVARAQLDAARLQLGYTLVRAPIAGRVGEAQVTQGALVSATEGTLLTRIEQLAPVYVSFSQSSAEVMQNRRGIADGTIDFDESVPAEVRIVFQDGSAYPIPGRIDFFNLSVDPTTGTINYRAEFPNPDAQLVPGEFVRAKVYLGTRRGGVAVPQSAVLMNADGAGVMVIDKDSRAAMRPVELGSMDGQRWVVQSGLEAGDVVIISNLQRIRPGALVVPAKSPAGGQADVQKGRR